MKRLQHLLSFVLIIAVGVLLIWLANTHVWNADWTAGNRNSLTKPSQRLLDAMPGPITFTAFAYPGPDRGEIKTQIGRYRRYRANITLKFVDPAKHPDAVRKLGIRHSGAVKVSYEGRSQIINKQLTEQVITNTLQQMSVTGQQWVAFLTGHGERSPKDDAGVGYSRLRKALDSQGLKVRGLNLVRTPHIPKKTAVLVIASPRHELLKGEVKIIKDYVSNGGNLLWVDDPGKRYGLQPLAKQLGVEWLKGTVLYPDYNKLGLGNPAMALVFNYGKQPVTQHLGGMTLFPFAGGLQAAPSRVSGWQHTAILKSPKRSWLEVGNLKAKEIKFDKARGDTLGPITLGLTLSRKVTVNTAKNKDTPQAKKAADTAGHGTKDDAAQNSAETKEPTTGQDAEKHRQTRQQRVAVIADSDFISNGYINTLDNMKFGIGLIQWLAHRDKQISIHVPPAPDSTLHLAPWQGRTIWYVFVIVLPLVLLFIGIGRWWLRRRR